MSRWCRWALVLGGLTMAADAGSGCSRRRATRAPDVCADGGCDDLVECELGDCDDPLDSTIARNHSPSAGTFADGAAASCPYIDGDLPPGETLFDDSKIPEFNRGRSRRTNYAQGNRELQDHELHDHLLRVQASLFDCLDIASCYQDTEIVGGELDFDFELEPTGRVSAVSVHPSTDLDQPIIKACARKSLYDFEFPRYNGARMVVSYRVEFAESM